MGFLLEEPVSSAPCLRAVGRWERGWRSLGEGGSWPEPLLRAPKSVSGLSTLGCADLLGWEQELKSPAGCGNALPAHRDPEHGSPRRCASRKCHRRSPPLPAPLHHDEGSSTSPPRSHVRARSSHTSPFQPFLQNPQKSFFPRISGPRCGCGPVHLSNELLLVLQKLGGFGGGSCEGKLRGIEGG